MSDKDKEDRRREARETLEVWEGAKKDLAREKAASRPAPVVHNGTWLNGQTFAPIAWLCPGLYPEGVTILAGKPKCGKSWLAYAIGLAAASGQWMLGAVPAGQPPPSPPPKRPVLYLALEDSDRRLKERAAILGWPVLPELFSYITSVADPEQALDVMHSWLGEHKGQHPIVIIDPWALLLPPARRGEGAYERDYRAGRNVTWIYQQHPGSSVLIIHHVRKEAGADLIDRVSGTMGMTGSKDTVSVLAGNRLEVKGRDVEDTEVALTGKPCWELYGGSVQEAARAAEAEAGRENLGDRSIQILNKLDAQGQVTTAEVAQMLGVTSDVASMHLGKLAKSGKIQKLGRGIYGPRSDGKPGPLVPTYVLDGSDGRPIVPITPIGGDRARAREATWFLKDDGGYDWAAMYAAADHTA